MGTDATGPVEVVLEEKLANRDSGRFAPRKTVGGQILGDTGDVDTGTQYHGMAKLTGPRAKVTMKFANGTQLKLHLDGDRGPGLGAIFAGEKGKIEINRDKVASNPKELLKDKPATLGGRHDTAFHVQNWIECIKSRNPCNADIEIGLRATTLCYLVNIVAQRRPRRRGPPLGPGRRALHELRRGQQAAHPPAAQGLRIAGHRLSLAAAGILRRRTRSEWPSLPWSSRLVALVAKARHHIVTQLGSQFVN